jgi:hypothetical protein
MVKLKSDAGWMARQKMNIALGAVTVAKGDEKKLVEVFGNERPTEMNVTKKPVDPEQW